MLYAVDGHDDRKDHQLTKLKWEAHGRRRLKGSKEKKNTITEWEQKRDDTANCHRQP
jgi:hypothetical protein